MTIKRKEDSKKKRILLDAEEKRGRERKREAKKGISHSFSS